MRKSEDELPPQLHRARPQGEAEALMKSPRFYRACLIIGVGIALLLYGALNASLVRVILGVVLVVYGPKLAGYEA